MCILFQNMQSLCNKIPTLEAFLDDDADQYHAICVSKTWLKKEKEILVNVQGYVLASSFHRTNYAGGGVCILLREDLEYEERKDIVDLSNEYVIEISAIELKNLNVIILVIYWNSRESEIFYRQLKNTLELLNKKYFGRKIIIGGDFNVDISENSTQSHTLLDFMLQYNFHQYVSEPTRITPTTATCIDLLFTNYVDDNLSTTICDLGFSDHKSIKMCTKLKIKPTRKYWHTSKRLYNRRNISHFKLELQKTEWNQLLKPDKGINYNYNVFNSTLHNILNRCIPKKNIKLKTNKRNKFWLSKGIKISCKNKRILKSFILYNKNNILNNHYKRYSKMLKNIINESRKQQYIKEIKKSDNIMKSMWKIVKERTNKNRTITYNNTELNINNILTNNPKQVANAFNSFFSSIGRVCGNNGAGAGATAPRGRPVLHPTSNSLFLSPVEPQEVYKLIKSLKNRRSSGIDEIPSILIKECAHELVWPFHELINQSFREGIFPDALKKSIIIPIYKKKGEKTDPSNYRPIALLPTSSKIFEAAMSKRLVSFCEKYSIFDENQYGFRKNRNTTLAVYRYIQQILDIINEKKYGIGILIDMTKAYDTVQYKILLDKLHGIGVRGTTHKWFASYLNNREQVVNIKFSDHNSGEIIPITSETQKIQNSIPQGSVLGCILFLIYINDLPKITHESCVLFADDVSLLFSCSDYLNLNQTLDNTILNIEEWMEDHNLKINFAKTKLMQFRPYQKNPLHVNYSFKGYKLECVDHFTLLGLDIDTNINWKKHVQKLKSKLSQFLYALRELKKTTDLNSAVAAYYAFVYSRLSYGILLWGNSTTVDELFILQKKCVRILSNIDNTESCKPFFKKHGILTLISIYIFEACKFVRKNPQFFKKIADQPRRFETRYKNKLMRPVLSKMKLHSNSPNVMCIKIFNKISNEIKDQTSDKIFNNQIKTLLINKSYYNLNEFFDDKC
jgi:hypothetical protein